MSSVTTNPIRFLSSDRPVTDARELLLTQFSGEILAAFEEEVAVADKVRRINIPVGEETQLIAVGETTARYHDPGVELLGQDYRTSQRKVRIDDKYLVADHAFYDMDEALAHFSVRGEIGRKMGYALSRTFDIHCLATLGRASLVNTLNSTGDEISCGYVENAVDPKIGTPGGSVLLKDLRGSGAVHTLAGVSNAVTLYDSFVEAAKIFDLKNVPAEGRYAMVPTSVWYDMLYARNSDQFFVNFNRDYMGPALQNKTDGRITAMQVAGITVMPTNRFLDSSVNGGYPSKYDFEWADCYAICWQSEATAAVMKQGIDLETTRDTRRLEDFMVSKMLTGHDVIRPECAITIWDDAIGGTVDSVIDDSTLAGVRTNAMNLFNQ